MSCLGATKLERKLRVNELPSVSIDMLVALAGKGISRPHSKTLVIIASCLAGFRLSLAFDEDKYKTAKEMKPTIHDMLVIGTISFEDLVLFRIVFLYQAFKFTTRLLPNYDVYESSR